jgi:hypothetical protein
MDNRVLQAASDVPSDMPSDMPSDIPSLGGPTMQPSMTTSSLPTIIGDRGGVTSSSSPLLSACIAVPAMAMAWQLYQ